MNTPITSDTSFENLVFHASGGAVISAESAGNLPIAVDLELEGPDSGSVHPVVINGFVPGSVGTRISLDYFFLNLTKAFQDGNVQSAYAGGNPFTAEGGSFLTLVQGDDGTHLVANYNAYNEHAGNFVDYHETIAVLTGVQAGNLTDANFNSVSQGRTFTPSLSADASLLGAGGGVYGLEGSKTSLIGGNGDDDLSDGGGDGTLIGGAGNNVYHVSNANSWVVDAGGGGEIHSSVPLDLGSPQVSGVNKLVYTGTSGGYLHGNNNDDDIEGGEGDDSVVAGAGNDTLSGGAGNDTISGAGGNDSIAGGAGNDVISGGAGEDVADYAGVTSDLAINLATGVATGDGSDVLNGIEDANGGEGDDLIGGDKGNNILAGGGGNDVIGGGAGNDSLNGGTGNDTMTGGAGNDIVTGGDGEDEVDYSAFAKKLAINLATGVATGDGTDVLSGIEDAVGGGNDDNITGDSLNNALSGGGGSDLLNGGGGNDVLNGGVGNDTVTGGAGDDFIEGGVGRDLANYGSDTADLAINLALGIATGDGADTLSGIEDACGGSGDDDITGDSLNNGLSGGAGRDSLNGGGGNDVLNGGAGNDTMTGGAGNDLMAGGAGEDMADYGAATSNLVVNLTKGVATGDGTDTLSGIEDVNGGEGNDVISGDKADNILAGGGGNDLLGGGAGNDTMTGGAGNDSIAGGGGNDLMEGGDGEDAADYSAFGKKLMVNLSTGIAVGDGTDTLVGIEDVVGGGNNDTLIGSGAGNVLYGGAGNDSLNGGGGNDSVNGGAGNDIVAGSSSSNAGGEIDTLTGGAGADLFILGNAGGRLYDDGVAGSGSSDYALITDFTPGVDLLQLKGVGTSYFLGSSGIPGLAGSGVYFDSNGNGSQDSLDELIAVVQTSTSSPLPNLGAIARFV